MADSNVPITPGSGRAVDTSSFTIGTTPVDRQRVVIGDDVAAGNLATVKAASTAAVAADEALVVGLHPSSPVPLPAIAKGTQGATGVTVQNLRDAGRTNWNAWAESVTGVGTEALFSLSISSGFAAPGTAATSYTVPTGKTLRLVSLSAAVVATSTALNTTRLRLRVNTAGASIISSPVVWTIRVGATAGTAAANTAAVATFPFPDGVEIPAGAGLAVSHVETATTCTVDLAIDGFLY